MKSLVLLILFFSHFSFAQNISQTEVTENHWPNVPKPFLDSIIFGVQAGFLVGVAAITGFRTNFQKNVDYGNISRGMSWGLYTGIILGLYLTSVSNSKSSQEPSEQNKSEHVEQNVNQTSRIMYKINSQPRWAIVPIMNENQIDGLALNIEIFRF